MWFTTSTALWFFYLTITSERRGLSRSYKMQRLTTNSFLFYFCLTSRYLLPSLCVTVDIWPRSLKVMHQQIKSAKLWIYYFCRWIYDHFLTWHAPRTPMSCTVSILHVSVQSPLTVHSPLTVCVQLQGTHCQLTFVKLLTLQCWRDNWRHTVLV